MQKSWTKVMLEMEKVLLEAILCQYRSAYSDFIFCAASIPWPIVNSARESVFRKTVNASLSENGRQIDL